MADTKVPNLNRRKFVSGSAATVATVAAALSTRFSRAEDKIKAAGVGGLINHSACKWCYPKISLEALCEAGKEFGLRSVELLTPDDKPTLDKYGMDCACLLYTSPSPRDLSTSRMPSSA